MSVLLERVPVEVVRPLRLDVLRAGMPPEAAVFEGDDHPEAAHFDIRRRDTGDVLSVGTIYPDPPPWDPDRDGAWRIRGMATKDGERGNGYGRDVLDALVHHALERGGTLAWCNARIGATEFYRRAGFVTTGEVFDDGVAVHQAMWRPLSDVGKSPS
jgi:GNAT superfamily N-acetyltransferase